MDATKMLCIIIVTLTMILVSQYYIVSTHFAQVFKDWS